MRHNAYEVADAIESVGPEVNHALRAAINITVRAARTNIIRNVAQEMGFPVRRFGKRAFVQRAKLQGGVWRAVLSIATADYPARLLRPAQQRSGVKFGGRGSRTLVKGGFIARRHPKVGQVEPVPYKRRSSTRLPLETLGVPVREPVARTAAGWVRSIGIPLLARTFEREYAFRIARRLSRVR